MSSVGAWLSRAIAALGGPQAAAAVLVAGLVVGGLGGAVVAGAGRQGGATAASGSVSVYPCPDQGPAVATVAGGQQLLVTGRLADDTWLRIHLPVPGRTEGWVEAGLVTVDGSLDSLPVSGCGPVVAVAPPAVAPVESMTAVLNLPPSQPPTAAPTPAPTPTPTPNSGPTLASLTASPGTISYDQGSYCPTAARTTTISVSASDSSGVATVTLFWRAPGAGAFARLAMAQAGGSSTAGTWSASLDTVTNSITLAGTLQYYVVSADTGGATSRLPASGAGSIAVAVCANTGPAIRSASSSSGSSLSWDPLGVGTCQTATNITAVVTDTDGVGSVTLMFRRPGSSSWASKPMDNHTIVGKWYANLDTLGDGITIPTPPSGTLSWYIKAVDVKGKASQTKPSSIAVRRCDTGATFGSSGASSASICRAQPISFYGSASDPDGIGPTSAVLVYTYWAGGMAQQTVQAQMTGSWDGRWYYDVTVIPPPDLGDNRQLVTTYYLQTTDAYGGTSEGGAGKIVQFCRRP